MSYRTLEDILVAVNSTLDLDASLPSGTELTLRANFANQAVQDASAVAQFSEFKNEYIANISTNITLPLPSNFRELQDDPHMLVGSNWEPFPEIEAEERYQRLSSERYCYVLGNPSSGYNLIFNQPISGATVSIIYQRFPSGMQTLTDVCELSDPTFVTRQVESYVLYARGDDKFPTASSRAQQALLNLTGREMKGAGGQPKATRSSMRNPLG